MSPQNQSKKYHLLFKMIQKISFVTFGAAIKKKKTAIHFAV